MLCTSSKVPVVVYRPVENEILKLSLRILHCNTALHKEINNGRLAMLAVAGILAQESVTGVPVF